MRADLLASEPEMEMFARLSKPGKVEMRIVPISLK